MFFKKIIKGIMAIALSVLTVMAGFISSATTVYSAYAESVYTSVLEDLQSDENFNADEYPSIVDNYSLQVIQIAESVDRELFIYVYQPSNDTKDLHATSINISRNKDGTDVSNYDLILLSTSGVFDKYKVKDFTVNVEADIRYYYIPSIYRAFDKNIDDSPIDDNTIEEKACSVAQLWKAVTVKDDVIYDMDYMEVIRVENKHVGFIRYTDLDLFATYSGTDSHYVAFSTDKPIDKLLSAKIMYSYTTSTLITTSGTSRETLENTVDVEKMLYAEEIFSKESWFWDDYEYNRIQETTQFLATETVDFTEETQKVLQETKWFLRFFESGYMYNSQFITDVSSPIQILQETWTSTKVTSVSILNLEFEYDGKIYNMGVVDDITHGDTNPDGVGVKPPINWLKILLFVVVGLLLIFYGPKLLVAVVQGVFDILVGIFSGGRRK